MKIKRIKKLKVNSEEFDVVWDKTHSGGSFCYDKMIINIGIKHSKDSYIFMLICHELMEICAIEMQVRYSRPDCDSDYLFSYDHRQHTTMIDMFSSLVSQFIQ